LRNLCSLCLVFLVVALGVFASVDADGDPTTPNIPLVSLVADAHIEVNDEAIHPASTPDLISRDKKVNLVLRRFAEWLGASAHRWQSRVLPIRGP